MKSILRSRMAAFAHDTLMTPLAWLGAYWLRFNLEQIPAQYLQPALQLLPFVMLTQASMYWYFGLYRGVWRYASLPDLARITKSIGLAVVLLAAVIYYVAHIPRSILPIYGILLLVLLGGPRLLYRWAKDYKLSAAFKQRALVVGAGDAGEQLVRELLRLRGDYVPVGFIDDDEAKYGREIHGLRVLGGAGDIAAVARRHTVDMVIIALPSATRPQMREVVEACEAAALRFITLPNTTDVLSGKVTLSDLREVSIEDLLGREPVSLDWGAIRAGIHNKSVLVTGGGGSIGSELCRQIARIGPARLTVLDHSEYNVYAIERELRRDYPHVDLNARLVDVSRYHAIHRAMANARPDMVFHAAAYKHVPLLEGHISEAVLNNVLGTRNTMRAAVECHVDGFVLISTDKAVNPVNILGASKRVAEILCQGLSPGPAANGGTRFIVVRFGNVLNSTGSVVPTFRRQIERGGPVTVTHRAVTRYFMTIAEACQLILQAGVIGAGREIYVLDMGEPVKISYLAEQMILLSGREPGAQIEIQYTGLRAGEKLSEELFHREEDLSPTKINKIKLARARAMPTVDIEKALDELEAACRLYDEDKILAIMREMVPEYAPNMPTAKRHDTHPD